MPADEKAVQGFQDLRELGIREADLQQAFNACVNACYVMHVSWTYLMIELRHLQTPTLTARQLSDLSEELRRVTLNQRTQTQKAE